MGLLIVRKGVVLDGPEDWSRLEEYPKKAVDVCIWPFERSDAGKVTVTYKDGAIAMFTGDSFTNLVAYMESLEGWPKPRVFYKKLPAIGFCPEDTPGKADDDVVEEAEIVVHHRRSRVRGGNNVTARGNTGTAARVRRVRAG